MHNYNFFKEIVRTFLYNLIFVSHKDVLFIHNCIKQIQNMIPFAKKLIV